MAEMLSGEQKGMRRRGPQPGTRNAADPATVLQRGLSMRSAVSGGDGSQGAAGQSKTAKRKSHWGGNTISRGRTPLSLRIVRSFVSPANPGKARRTRRSFRRPRPASQETCHPRAWCPHWGFFPVASTEVVVATSCIRGSLSTRRCRSVFWGRASFDFSCMLKACTTDRLRAVEGHGNP